MTVLTLRHLATAAALLAAACSSDPPPSGNLPPNPERATGAALTLIDTQPTGQRCVVSGGKVPPLTVTTPRLVELSRFAPAPVVDCFAEGYYRVRKAVPARSSSGLTARLGQTGMVDPAFGPDLKAGAEGGRLYPQWVRITLQENVFKSVAERDRYYAAESIRIQQDWGAIEQRLNRECESNKKPEAKGLILLSPECRNARKSLADRRTADLAASEVNRRQSTIR